MASRYDSRRHPIFHGERSARYMRKETRDRPVKMPRKSRLTARHIILTYVFLGFFFFGVERLWLYLISWEELTIKNVEVICSHPRLNTQVKSQVARIPMGNILLLDPARISGALKELPWASEVRVHKIFPNSLIVNVQERHPWALLEREGLYLIDREGSVLEPAGQGTAGSYPLLTDTAGFSRDYRDKIQQAGELLDPLNSEEKSIIAVLDLTSRNNMKVRLKTSQTELYLGEEEPAEKFRYYQKIKGRLDLYGRLQYVDLRFSDRIYLKIQPDTNLAAIPLEKRR